MDHEDQIIYELFSKTEKAFDHTGISVRHTNRYREVMLLFIVFLTFSIYFLGSDEDVNMYLGNEVMAVFSNCFELLESGMTQIASAM